VIGPLQRPPSDSAHHSQKTGIHALAGSESPNPVSRRPQTHALNRAATGIGIPNVQISRLFSHGPQLGLHSSSGPLRPSAKSLYAFQDARCRLYNRIFSFFLSTTQQ